jgi:hypothetical protein
MSPITAQTADHIDYWIRLHVVQFCCGTHPSQSHSKFNPARHRYVGLTAIGLSLKDQYDALASPMPLHLAALVKQLEMQKIKSVPTHGYAETREAAMAAFAKS